MKRALLVTLALVACKDGSPSHAPPTAPPTAPVTAAAAGPDASRDLRLTDGTVLRLVDAERGRALLGARDPFVAALSPFDRQVRTGSRSPVDEATYLAHVRANVVDWDDERRSAVDTASAELAAALASADLTLPLPPVIEVVLATGKEEIPDAAYTRGRTIVLSQGSVKASMHGLLAHELFHVLSRNAPVLRDALYAAIGFEPIEPLVLPPSLSARRITNPDAPVVAHAIRIGHQGRRRLATPVLVAPRAYDGGSLFDYVVPTMYVLDDKGAVALEGGKPVTVAFDQADGFYESVGRNTGYVIHPEEILADSFRMIVFPPDTVPSPAVLDRVRDVLRGR